MGVDVPVVIIGAGPTGITAATLLAQYGVECLVLDRWADVYPQPRAVHLDDEIRRVLSCLGVDNEFASISRPAQGLRLLDRGMRVLAEFRRDSGLHGYPPANMFDQPEFETLLRANAKNYPRVAIRTNSEVTAITQHDGVRVTVEFTDRISSARDYVEAAYVLGCDGANSIARTAIGARMVDLRFQQRWLIVDVATTAPLHQWEGVHQVCDPIRAATYIRIGEARYRWEFRLLPGETAAGYGTIANLKSLIAPWVDDIALDELELVRVTEYTFRAQVADRWRDRNVFLLGDAAHLTPPFIGQGMGAGLRDAMNLSWKLAGVLTGDLPATVLATYEQERKPHVRYMIRFALGIGWAMTAGGDFGNFIRRTIVPRLHLIPGMRRKIVDSTTPALHRSAMVLKSRAPRPLAGTLCPNLPLRQGARFDDVVGNRFALVTASPLSRAQCDEIGRRGAAVVAAEPGTELARWLHRGRATAAIVRPDRTVMRAGRRLAVLCDSMPRFRPATRICDA